MLWSAASLIILHTTDGKEKCISWANIPRTFSNVVSLFITAVEIIESFSTSCKQSSYLPNICALPKPGITYYVKNDPC